jgi:hypothetical protein
MTGSEAIALLTLRISSSVAAMQVTNGQALAQFGPITAVASGRQVIVINPASGRLGPITAVATAQQTLVATATARLVPSVIAHLA